MQATIQLQLHLSLVKRWGIKAKVTTTAKRTQIYTLFAAEEVCIRNK